MSTYYGSVYKYPIPEDSHIYGATENQLSMNELIKMDLKGLPVYEEHNHDNIIGNVTECFADKNDGLVIGLEIRDKYKQDIQNKINIGKLKDLSLSHAFTENTPFGVEVSLTSAGNRFGTNIIKNKDKINYYRTQSKLLNKANETMTDVQPAETTQPVPAEKTEDNSLLKVMNGLKSDNVKLMDMSNKLNEELVSQKKEIDEYKAIIEKYKLQEKNQKLQDLEKNGPGLLEQLKKAGIDLNDKEMSSQVLDLLNKTVLHMNSVHEKKTHMSKRANIESSMKGYDQLKEKSVLGKRKVEDVEGFSDGLNAMRKRIMRY